ncbi:MAG: TAXI family TRAP transporter solute-binding subunit [SAR324 cluster bacterium]|nr:TAXI family TRAP transporter solute-binding subunit [SAR324 cluster bacterium]
MYKRILSYKVALWLAVLVFIGAGTSTIEAKKRIVFAGGPAGGTFQVVANSIQIYDPIKALKDYNIKAQASAGSTENLRLTDSGRANFGVMHSGQLWQASNGVLKGDTKKYKNVLAVSFLYVSPAQLVVKKNSGIKSVKDLIGKRVGVGNAGSGAFANCELFFTHLGIWDKIDRNAMGYNDAAQAFGNNQLDAFWLFTAYPSGAVILAAQTNDIAMIDLAKDAKDSGYFKAFPYLSELSIPAGTYRGVDTPVNSFQDSSIWVANKDVPAQLVYDMLNIIYTKKGLDYMHKAKSTFKDMSIATGTNGIATAFHPGAIKFWKEKGKL